MEKISVVIPNYNGKKLLTQNLPNVIKNCTGCEIIVVDDGSTDGSAKFLKENFKNIKILENPKNLGFSRAINIGVRKASHNLVLLLNSDVSPKSNFLTASVKYFNVSKDVFAVALADYSHEGNKVVIRGRGGANFKKGFLNHFAAGAKKGETFWVSGGSGIFDREKFLKLSGFDPIYAPFYWEDIDLSYRAAKSGYKCYFEPRSKVDHFHEEGAIKTEFSTSFIKTVSYKNQFLFVWRNISDPMLLIQHVCWLPYHFLKATLSFDMAFFIGFFWALTKIPFLIFNHSLLTINHSLSDQEVLNKFAKQ